jgi:hypothetical protein
MPSSSPLDSPRRSPPVGGALLGTFIVVQLAFILLANAGSVALFFANSESPLPGMAWNAIGAFSEPWAHCTGQEQYWRMFAPSAPTRATFVRLRIHTDGKSVMIPSEFEPPPGEAMLHLPGCGERLWHVEKSLAAPFLVYNPVDVEGRLTEWRSYLDGAIGGQRHRYLAYMSWKLRRHQEATGDTRVPDEVDLLVSLHTLSSHDALGAPEFELLALRWRPALGSNAVQLCTDTPRGVDCAPFGK